MTWKFFPPARQTHLYHIPTDPILVCRWRASVLVPRIISRKIDFVCKKLKIFSLSYRSHVMNRGIRARGSSSCWPSPGWAGGCHSGTGWDATLLVSPAHPWAWHRSRRLGSSTAPATREGPERGPGPARRVPLRPSDTKIFQTLITFVCRQNKSHA